MILGHAPLWQPLVPAPGGRWQAHELAFDPARHDWFNVFGEENRQPGEWGHWTGRGINWNTMCAPCHMTGYDAGYDPATDTFKSTWTEQGIGCVSCHGTPPADHATSAKKAPYDPFRGDRDLMMQTCAPCHARNEPLTGRFQPGDNYHDHYRVTLPTEARTFYPDGQQRDEDFNWTSLLTSRMGHAGVTCLDCHDPHTNKTILPVENNALCMQCHSAPGRVMPGGARAVPIEPLAHSRHAEGTAGNQCVSCHMPTTNYMQRAPRHDHGWIKPDPLLTRELGIPNACSKCHQTEGLDWVIARADAWYGSKLESHQRARTRAVAALQTGAPSAVAPALAVLGLEEVPAWRATLLELLAPHVAEPAARTTLTTALAAPAPLERAAAVRALTPLPDARPLLRPLLDDPVRLVRLDAAWALSADLPADSSHRRELDAYLHLNQDQPAGLARIGMDLANRGRFDEALTKFERAREWDSAQSEINSIIAQLLYAQGKPAAAGAAYLRAATANPDDAESPYRAGLAYAEAGLKADAEKALRLSLARDPSRDRAWYNLGLLLAANNRLHDALAALTEAERRAPRLAEYPYAIATLHLRLGDRSAARASALRALAIDPAHTPSRRLLSTP
jgi:predicted CXXCH cytochrome family protein